jgi:hypothetical protein
MIGRGDVNDKMAGMRRWVKTRVESDVWHVDQSETDNSLSGPDTLDRHWRATSSRLIIRNRARGESSRERR